jgi:hypothetical protein
MILTIHNNLEKYENFLTKIKHKHRGLTFWSKYTNILMSDDKCFLHFAQTGDDFWELHIAFDKAYRGKKSLHIIKQGIQWMLDNKTSRIICAIQSERKDVRALANFVGFKKVFKREKNNNNYECYEIRS